MKEKNLKSNENKENEITREKQLLQPKIDVVFQSLFNKNNMEITKSFVEVLLEEKIETIEINSDKDLIREKPEDKLGILDLELDVNNKEKIDVEIQLSKRTEFVKRILWYLTRMYSKQIKKGDKYKNLKKVMLIAIIDFDLKETEELKEMETIWKLIETKNREKILTEDIEIRIIELSKAKEMYKKNKDNEKAQWMLFINNPNSEEVKEIMKKNKDIKECIIKVKELTEDEKMERLAFLRERARMDEESLRDEGYEEGIKESKKNIIKNLYSVANMPIEQIADIAEVSKEEVKEILGENVREN